MTVAPDDHARVCELLGREPRGDYDIVVRDGAGDPVVLRNAPLLGDGTPMPTRYWLIGSDEVRRIGRIESAGGVDRAEAAVDDTELADAHTRYASERDEAIPDDHEGPRPSGGVGGTRVGVKCLHAHWAWHLAGGDDPVGRWIAHELAVLDRLHLIIDGAAIRLEHAGASWTLPIGPAALLDRWLRDDDPPRPESLTNALGEVADHLDDALRERPEIGEVGSADVSGPGAHTIARLEVGVADPPMPIEIDRDTAEEVFRLAATEPLAVRAHNPGLPSSDVETVLADLCVVVGTMRRLGLSRVTLLAEPTPPNGRDRG